MKKKQYLIFLFFFMLGGVILPCSSLAAIRKFSPKLMGYAGALELESLYKKDKRDSRTISLKRDRFSLKESLALRSLWYVYHPRFFYTDATIKLGTVYDRLRSPDEDSRFDSLEEYNIHGYFLVTHPYNLELFAERKIPLSESVNSLDEIAPYDTWGSIFSYKKKPWFGNVKYKQNSYDRKISMKSNTLDSSLMYFTPDFWNRLNFKHVDSWQNSDKTTSDTLTGMGYLKYNMVKFNTRFDILDRSSDTTENKSAFFEDRLEAELPWNFTANLKASQRKDRDITEKNTSNERQVLNSEEKYEYILSHQLYSSVYSEARYRDEKYTISRGENLKNEYLLKSEYTKQLRPVKGDLSMNVQYSDTETERDIPLTSDVELTEIFANVTLDGSFTSRNTEIDIRTVRVEVLTDPILDINSDASYTELDQNVHYRIESSTTYAVEITIDEIDLPLAVVRSNPYRFRIHYKLLPGNHVLAVSKLRYGIASNLFNNYLTGKFTQTHATQETLRGDFFLGNLAKDVTTTDWAGTLGKGMFRSGLHYNEVDAGRDFQEKWIVFSQGVYNRTFAYDIKSRMLVRLTGTRFRNRLINGIGQPDYSTREVRTGLNLNKSSQYANIEFSSDYRQTTKPNFVQEVLSSLQYNRILPKIGVKIGYEAKYSYLQEKGDRPIVLKEVPFSGARILEQETNILTDYTEKEMQNNITVESFFPELHMSARLLGGYSNYSFEKDNVITQNDYLTLTSQLIWRVGRLQVQFDADYSSNIKDTGTSSGENSDSELEFRLNIIRQLF